MLAARVVLTGATRAHAALRDRAEQYTNEVRLAANDVGGGEIFVENVVFATQSHVDLAMVREQADAVGQLARALHDMKSDDASLAMLHDELAELRHKLPLELAQGPGAIALDTEHLRRVLADVEQMLVPRLLAPSEGPP
jgi:hypothetical protein